MTLNEATWRPYMTLNEATWRPYGAIYRVRDGHMEPYTGSGMAIYGPRIQGPRWPYTAIYRVLDIGSGRRKCRVREA